MKKIAGERVRRLFLRRALQEWERNPHQQFFTDLLPFMEVLNAVDKRIEREQMDRVTESLHHDGLIRLAAWFDPSDPGRAAFQITEAGRAYITGIVEKDRALRESRLALIVAGLAMIASIAQLYLK